MPTSGAIPRSDAVLSARTRSPIVSSAPAPLKRWLCSVCGLIYDEAEGWPEEGIAPGTRWDEVPLNWACPDCGAVKDDFDMVEVS